MFKINLCLLLSMKLILITASADITGFKSPASDYLQLPLAWWMNISRAPKRHVH
jgi:hypothetical protein